MSQPTLQELATALRPAPLGPVTAEELWSVLAETAREADRLQAENAQLRRCLRGDHDWKDVTAHGDRERVSLCLCGERATVALQEES